MRALFANISGLTGLLVLLNHMWSYASLERTLLSAFGTGVAVYLVLILGYVSVRRILAHAPPADESERDDEAQNEETQTEEATPEMQTA